jgi:hypothetical protein
MKAWISIIKIKLNKRPLNMSPHLFQWAQAALKSWSFRTLLHYLALRFNKISHRRTSITHKSLSITSKSASLVTQCNYIVLNSKREESRWRPNKSKIIIFTNQLTFPSNHLSYCHKLVACPTLTTRNRLLLSWRHITIICSPNPTFQLH